MPGIERMFDLMGKLGFGFLMSGVVATRFIFVVDGGEDACDASEDFECESVDGCEWIPEYEGAPVAEGKARVGEPQISPAQEAALRMEKVIHDQLMGSNAISTLRNAIFESALLGTGIIKGPFTHTKTVHKWGTNEMGEKEYTPYLK